jgi:hypothetical protein
MYRYLIVPQIPSYRHGCHVQYFRGAVGNGPTSTYQSGERYLPNGPGNGLRASYDTNLEQFHPGGQRFKIAWPERAPRYRQIGQRVTSISPPTSPTWESVAVVSRREPQWILTSLFAGAKQNQPIMTVYLVGTEYSQWAHRRVGRPRTRNQQTRSNFSSCH